jgi:hypothetical protein
LSGVVAKDLSGFICTVGGAYEMDRVTTGDPEELRFEEAYGDWSGDRLTFAFTRLSGARRGWAIRL